MTLFVSYDYIKEETSISDNIDDKMLLNPLKRAQEMLKFLLGKAFYESIESQVESTYFTDDDDALFDPYIKRFLAWQAYEFYAIRANVYESRTGFRQFREDNSDIASETIMSNIIKDAKQWAQFYKGEITTFIKQQQNIDSTKYPLFNDCGVRQGNSFHITAITKKDPINRKINRQSFNNE